MWHVLTTCRMEFIIKAISRKIVGKNVLATIPNGNMGYDQYTVPDDCSSRTYFCCFPLALTNICPWPLVLFFQISLKNGIQNHPQTIPIGIGACTFSHNLSRNSCIRGVAMTPLQRNYIYASMQSQCFKIDL